ncbi:MAG: radical SAM protein [Proteobacteria bacterium]|nr:radical SAM protein [Pseudomonadota bacterium]
MSRPLQEDMLERERVANRAKHWVRAVTACNSRCLFCLDSDTPRNLFLPAEDVKADLRRGIEDKGADKVILSGGEASLHPEFLDFIRYGREIGYDRVQTVTNGWMLAQADFYEEAVQAGLGEITWSLHGHTAELHDHLTGTPGAFDRMVAGIRRAEADPRIISNVDVVINKQNVGVLDKVVELAMSLGVTEFDLLHVIPQAAAFEHRDDLFYDPAEHLDVLHKVFRLNRHPGFVIWTNRFPVPFLEGLEDLIQDPHKMLDEVHGRRFQVRRYLDVGQGLDCRQPERCVHCFIEPFCTSTDRTLDRIHAAGWEVWFGDGPLPFGATRRGVAAPSTDALPDERPLYAEVEGVGPVPEGDVVLRAERAEQLEAWAGSVDLDVQLNRDTVPWLLTNRDRLERMRIHQPSWSSLEQAAAHDVRDPARFFLQLDRPIPTSGLAACQAPGATLVEPRPILRSSLFDAGTGRPSVPALAEDHVADGYRVHSLRCRTCRVRDRCDGIHVNMVRDQGLKLARPLVAGAWPDEADRQLTKAVARVRDGRERVPVVPSLPGHDAPAAPPEDPLAVLARDKAEQRAKRRLQILDS